MSDFVHLHLHSEYSLLDGACRIQEIAKKALKEGHSAVAITDHGAMYGAVSFYKECKKVGVKPIIGCEVYVARNSRFDRNGKLDMSGNHLVLLCKNETGYKNLIFLVSSGFTEGFYSRPRIDYELLSKHSEGLIALSACVAGAIPSSILAGDYVKAEEHALKLQNIFGKDNFYLEIQNHGLDDEAIVAKGIEKISSKLGIPMVATNDVHYIERKDADVQAVLMCIQTNNLLSDGRPLGFETNEFYYKSTKEMETLFSKYDGAIENTVKIAEMCNFDFKFGEVHLPKIPCVHGTSHKDSLRKFAINGLNALINQGRIDFSFGTREEYIERIDYELGIIDNMGFNEYYLIVRDFIAYAKENGIPVGPGRGSGAGSMVAFCVGITDIDPFAFGLLFERFLNPERISMPDFDTDFCYERREEVIEYVKEKYGNDHVSQIITFGTLAPRAAIRDVGRALGMPYSEVDKVARLIPQELGVTFESAMKSTDLQALYNDDSNIRNLIDISRKLEGMPRHASTHAAGVVITESPVNEYVPLAINGDVTVTEYDMDTIASLGLVKFDFLGLRYLTIIADAEREIRENNPSFAIEKVPFDDKLTYDLISAGNTDGVFQLESAGMKQMLTELKPESIYDVTAAIALYRPGPMASIPQYIARKHGKEPIVYDTPLLKNILDETYGCIVYQEQVMRIFQTLAGYTFARADTVRRAMAKKKSAELKSEKEAFISGAEAKGLSEELAEKIFNDMLSFANYAFNKSHASAYAVISYRTAYLKAHYPKEYMSAMLTSVFGNTAKMNEYVSECSRMGISVLAPDINESKLNFTVSENGIRFGLLAIKNAGRPFVETVLNERRIKKFTSFEDFVRRMSNHGITKRQLEFLIKCGAFDKLGVFRSQLLNSYEKILDEINTKNHENITGQIDIFSSLLDSEEKDSSNSTYVYPDIPEFNIRELLILEKESSGMYFSGHILDGYKNHINSVKHENIIDIKTSFDESSASDKKFSEKQQVSILGVINRRVNKVTKNGSKMAFLTLEDTSSEINVIVFSKELEKFGDMLCADMTVLITGTVTKKDEEDVEIILVSAFPLLSDADFKDKAEEKKGQAKDKKLYIRVCSMSSEECQKALMIAQSHKGSTPLIIYSGEDKKYYNSKNNSVAFDKNLYEKLVSLLGKENVILK